MNSPKFNVLLLEFQWDLFTLLLVYLLEHSGFANWDSDYVNSFLIFGKNAFWGKMVFIVKIHEIFHNLHDTVCVSAGRVFPVHPDFHFYWLINMFSWTCKYTFEVGPTRTCPLDRLMTDGHRKVPADKNILDSEHVVRSSSKWFWIQVCKISKMRSPWESEALKKI